MSVHPGFIIVRKNWRKPNVKPSTNSQSDSAWWPISNVFATQTKEGGFNNFHIWPVASSLIRADFNRSPISSLHRLSGGIWWTSRVASIVRSAWWARLKGWLGFVPGSWSSSPPLVTPLQHTKLAKQWWLDHSLRKWSFVFQANWC